MFPLIRGYGRQPAFTRATFESLGDVALIGLREPAIDDFNRFIRQ